MSKKFTTAHLCFIAFAIVINIVGSQIALTLRLPIYLDSIGTIFIAAICGPIYGMIPSLISGLLFGMTSDVYALYYAPVGIVLGALTGLVWKYKKETFWWPFLATLLITIPTSFFSSLITAHLFGGITSSGSSMLVQLLSKTPLGLTWSCFIVQWLTDYVDKWIGIILVLMIIKRLPSSFLQKLKR